MVKIEKVPMNARMSRTVFHEFCITLKNLKIGESFLWPIGSQHRTAITVMSIALDRRFATQAENNQHRVGRIE